MSLGEFDIIDRYFRRGKIERADVIVGIGDDGAVLSVADGRSLVTAVASVSADSPGAAGDDPALLGRQVTADALDRLAALGAEPAWLTLALTLPEAEQSWLESFSSALLDVAEAHGVALVGGDTTRGPLTVTVVAHGLIDQTGNR